MYFAVTLESVPQELLKCELMVWLWIIWNDLHITVTSRSGEFNMKQFQIMDKKKRT